MNHVAMHDVAYLRDSHGRDLTVKASNRFYDGKVYIAVQYPTHLGKCRLLKVYTQPAHEYHSERHYAIVPFEGGTRHRVNVWERDDLPEHL